MHGLTEDSPAVKSSSCDLSPFLDSAIVVAGDDTLIGIFGPRPFPPLVRRTLSPLPLLPLPGLVAFLLSKIPGASFLESCLASIDERLPSLDLAIKPLTSSLGEVTTESSVKNESPDPKSKAGRKPVAAGGELPVLVLLAVAAIPVTCGPGFENKENGRITRGSHGFETRGLLIG